MKLSFYSIIFVRYVWGQKHSPIAQLDRIKGIKAFMQEVLERFLGMKNSTDLVLMELAAVLDSDSQGRWLTHKALKVSNESELSALLGRELAKVKRRLLTKL